MNALVHSPHSGLRGNIPVRHHGRNSKRNQFPLVTADWIPARDKPPASRLVAGIPTLQWTETGVLGRKIDRLPRISIHYGERKGVRIRSTQSTEQSTPYRVSKFARQVRKGRINLGACISHGISMARPTPKPAKHQSNTNRTPRRRRRFGGRDRNAGEPIIRCTPRHASRGGGMS